MCRFKKSVLLRSCIVDWLDLAALERQLRAEDGAARKHQAVKDSM